MSFTRKHMAQVGTPCVVLAPWRPKMGHRLPSDLPVVVLAEHIDQVGDNGKDRYKLLRWLHLFVTMATYPERRANAPVYVIWQDDTLEEIDLTTCPRYET